MHPRPSPQPASPTPAVPARNPTLSALGLLALAAHRPLGLLAATALHLAAPSLALLGYEDAGRWADALASAERNAPERP